MLNFAGLTLLLEDGVSPSSQTPEDCPDIRLVQRSFQPLKKEMV